MRALIILLCALPLLATAETGTKHIYKTVGDLKLPLYVSSPKGHEASNKTPAIVFFFGGGWTKGSPSQFAPHCAHLAERGMVAITVEYRIKSKHGVTPVDCVEDAKSAMRWVRANATKLGIDPSRIAAGGGSAGGHLAACTALIEGFNAKTDDTEISPVPNAMVLFNPALAISPHEGLSDGDNALLKARARTMDLPLKDISPLNQVDQKQAPCLILFGTNDRLLPGAKVFQDRSKKAGNTCELVTYEGAGHGFFNKGRNGDKYYKLTLKEMDDFLVKLGWLEKDAK